MRNIGPWKRFSGNALSGRALAAGCFATEQSADSLFQHVAPEQVPPTRLQLTLDDTDLGEDVPIRFEPARFFTRKFPHPANRRRALQDVHRFAG